MRRRRHGGPAPSRPLRVWVPECATGEDAYSVAIGLLEALGKRWREVPLRVFFTDPDPDALAAARAARYPRSAARSVPRARLERFFSAEARRLRVRPFVREACRFTPHDRSRPSPFCALDLVCVRTTLAALPPRARLDALLLYHGALVPGGLLLDSTGSAAAAPDLFAPLGPAGAFSARPGAGARRAPASRLSPAVEDRLRESEERFRVLFSQVPDAMLLQDDASGNVVLANEAAVRLFGWSLPELLGRRADGLLGSPEALRPDGGERRSQERLSLPQFRRKDGTLFPADASASFLMLNGRPCTLQVVRDASPRLRAGSEGRREEEQRAFVGTVVHELRSPLAVISGSAQTLRRGVKGRSARRTILDFIQSHTRRMGRLVDRLLDVNAADSAQPGRAPARVPLAEFVWELVPAFIPLAKRRAISLKVDIAADLAVLADPADLPHLFGNLLDNAIKFTPRGGSVSVRGRSEGGEVLTTVTDSGGGIPPKDLTRVFERFYRSERTRKTKGNGLGLAIVQGIAKANCGRVYAENAPEGGAAFHVALPAAP